jgi:vitamin K-dependent gamma-carboxylase
VSGGRVQRLREILDRPVDAAGPAAFRILLGLLLCAGTLRFLASGWVPRFFEQPRFHFKYPGFGWVVAPPIEITTALVAALAVLALGIALGVCYRAAALLFALGYAYLELIDATNYLNHHYLAVLLALLLACLPLHRTWSVDAWLRPSLRRATLPRWTLWLLRLQVGVVYVYAGLAKLNSDWLLHAQPLNLWLTARIDTPLVGPLLDEPGLHLALSWAAFLFDTTVVGWLSWRRSRPYAYAVLLAFHAMTHVLFNIGMFPFIMSIAALLFFDPSWPRRLSPRLRRGATTAATADLGRRTPTPVLVVAALYASFQVLFPLRHYLYPGDVSWNEEGMRWSWKVMLREKHGAVTYRVRIPATGAEVVVHPSRYLDPRQEREMSGQPELILQLAHHIADDLRASGHGEVEVRADVRVSLNGRRPRSLIDPDRDLARTRSGLAPADWILPEPPEPPITLRPRVRR